MQQCGNAGYLHVIQSRDCVYHKDLLSLLSSQLGTSSYHHLIAHLANVYIHASEHESVPLLAGISVLVMLYDVYRCLCWTCWTTVVTIVLYCFWMLLAELLPGANWSGSSRPVTSEGCYSQEDWIVRTGEDGSGRLLTGWWFPQDTGSIKALPFPEARPTWLFSDPHRSTEFIRVPSLLVLSRTCACCCCHCSEFYSVRGADWWPPLKLCWPPIQLSVAGGVIQCLHEQYGKLHPKHP